MARKSEQAGRKPQATIPEASVSVAPASQVEVRLHRRRQAVVVRAGGSLEELEPPPHSGRRRMRTLPGLDQRERLDTLWDEADEVPESRVRPAVLIDDIDDQRAQEYRLEAERILRDGRLVTSG